jgi:predicted 2-oxoglutarate/Fe(II)-dependent dioxygenase YbiX
MSSITATFAAALSTVDRPGDFFTAGIQEMAVPRLDIEGVGPIALPLLPVQAEQLIATAERAPYGRGEETLTDPEVRRTWQIAPDRVRLGGRHWPKTLNTIVARVAEGLGVTGKVEARLYKLLIYDQGSFFVRHRDTEKAKGMFATLIVVVPSLSAGGELVVRHKEREVRLDLRCEEPSDIAFAAFYADCVHEVLPVTAGYRLALVYNLVRPGRGALPEPPHYAAQEDAVAELLRKWTRGLRSPDGGEPQKLIYPLEHAYTSAELSFQALKGADDGIARVVAVAAPRAGCDVHLALVSIEEDGSAEHTSYSGSRRGWSRYEDEDDNEFEVIEVDNRKVSASDWRRPDGEPSPLTVIPVEDDEVSPPAAFEGLDPDEQHFHEATGNEGASFERTYRRAALVLWPRERLFAVINQAGVEVTLPYLADLIKRWAASGKDNDLPLWREAHQLSGHMVATWPTRDWQPRGDNDATSTGQMLGLLCRLKDLMRLESLLAMIATRGGFDLGDSEPIADALRLLPPENAAVLLERIVRGAADRTLAACGTLLARVAMLDQVVVIGAARALVSSLPSSPVRDMWGRGPGVQPRLIVELFVALARIDPALADRAADHVLARPATYGFDEILVPAVRDLLGPDTTMHSAAIGRLRLACVAHLEERVAQSLEAPRDWGRASAVGCKCAHCKELSRFLADPEKERWVFRANESERRHVEMTIRGAHSDVGVTTERRGRPYSLICTKNQASYERRRKQRARDLADLKRLRL